MAHAFKIMDSTGISNSVESNQHDDEEFCNITVETLLDLLLTKYFSSEDKILSNQAEKLLLDFDKMLLQNFYKSTISVDLSDTRGIPVSRHASCV